MKRIVLFFIPLMLYASDFMDHFNKGIAAFTQNNFSLAQDHFLQAKALQPNQPELLYNLAVTYKNLDDKQEAISLLKRVIEIKPTYSKAYHLLINLLKETNQTAEITRNS